MFKTNLTKFIARFVIIALLLLPFRIQSSMIPYTLSNVWSVFIAKSIIPTIGESLLLIPFSHYFFERFNLLNFDKRELQICQKQPLLIDLSA